MQVRDDVILGLDIGVGSLGWALLEEDLQTGEQRLLQRQTPQGETTYALGVRLFHVPENPKTKELLNVKRRTARMQRRTTARRAQRMRRVRALLDSLGVPGVRDADAFHLGKGRGAQCDPWQLRREGLERRLEAREWAVVLLHIAKHRGFRSNSKTDRSGSDKEMGQVLQAVSNLQQEVEASGLTVGALLASRERRRNRADHTGAPRYDLCMLRSLQENEVDILFTRQRELGTLWPERRSGAVMRSWPSRSGRWLPSAIWWGRAPFWKGSAGPRASPPRPNCSVMSRRCAICACDRKQGKRRP